MTFLQRVRAIFSRKEESRQLLAMSKLGRPIATPRNYEQFAREGYQKNVVAFRAINEVSTACAGIPWVLYRKGRTGLKEEIEDHEILSVIRKPNPLMGQADLICAAVAYRKISGNAYLRGVMVGSQLKEIWLWRPDRTKIIPGSHGLPAAFVYAIGGSEYRADVDPVSGNSSVLHWKTFNPIDDWYGVGEIEAAMFGIDMHNEACNWNLALMQNAATPSGALVVQAGTGNPMGTLTDEQWSRVKKDIDESFSGSKNAGRPLILEGGMDWKSMSFSPQQMAWLDSKHTSARDVALAFGVPPQLLGIPGDNTYSNYKEAREALYEQTVLPTMDSLRDNLNRWIVEPQDGGLYLDYDRDEIEALSGKREKIWARVSAADFLTQNEKREAVGYAKIEDPAADELFVSATMVPIGFASEDPTDDQGEQDQQKTDKEPEEDPAKPDDEESGKAADSQLEGKIFNLSTNKEKVLEWKRTVRMRAALERKLARQMAALFKAERDRILDAIDGLSGPAVEHAAEAEIRESETQMKRVIGAALTSTGNLFGKRVLKSLKHRPVRFEIKADSDVVFGSFLTEWVERNVGERVTEIIGTSRKKVVKAIQDAVLEATDEGEGAALLAKRIEDVYDGFAGARAMTIARTEILAASNAASEGAAKATGIPRLRKEWIAEVGSGRTRDAHAEANGQIVDIDDEFTVGGERLKHPGDPKGSPENIIQCRCTIAFLTEGEE